MARTINEIKQTITTAFMENETLAAAYGYARGTNFDDVFSRVSLESIMFYIVASAMFVVESMFDVLRVGVDDALAQRLTHNRQWYTNTAREFQFGDEINPETGRYDIIDISKQVVNHAAVDEINGMLRLKVATMDGEELAPLSSAQLTAFTGYMQLVKDAGVVIEIITAPGDDLRLVIDILYDPLVLDNTGQAFDGSDEPAKDAILNYIKNLPFNGEFRIVALTDALQAAQGVVIPTVISAYSKYAAWDWSAINVRVKPNSGYMVIADANLTINYEPINVNSL